MDAGGRATPGAVAEGQGEGGQNMKSGEMTIYLEALKYRVLRFWNHEILIGAKAIPECIHQALIKSPLPNPSP